MKLSLAETGLSLVPPIRLRLSIVVFLLNLYTVLFELYSFSISFSLVSIFLCRVCSALPTRRFPTTAIATAEVRAALRVQGGK